MISIHRRDQLFGIALRLMALTSAGVIVLIALFVARESFAAFDGKATQGQSGLAQSNTEDGFEIADLLTDESWNPSSGQYNLTPMVVGSLLATFGSTLLTVPIGVGSAVFLNFYAPQKLAWLFRRVVEVMAGVPSVVYGLWGLSVLVPLIATISPIEQGQSLLAGILILSFMTIPTIVVAADAAVRAVHVSQIQAAAALGLSRRATAWSVVVPAARWGLFSSIILQITRAAGETMAVLMVCGNIVQTPRSIFEPIRTLTANIALEMGYADEQHRAVLFFSGFVGLALVAILMIFANSHSDSDSRQVKH